MSGLYERAERAVGTRDSFEKLVRGLFAAERITAHNLELVQDWFGMR